MSLAADEVDFFFTQFILCIDGCFNFGIQKKAYFSFIVLGYFFSLKRSKQMRNSSSHQLSDKKLNQYKTHLAQKHSFLHLFLYFKRISSLRISIQCQLCRTLLCKFSMFPFIVTSFRQSFTCSIFFKTYNPIKNSVAHFLSMFKMEEHYPVKRTSTFNMYWSLLNAFFFFWNSQLFIIC